MKVIAVKSENYSKSYICEVTHQELEKFLNLYFGKLDVLKDGDVIDLGKGYDHASEIKSAMKKTQDFIDSHPKIIKSILMGIEIGGKNDT